MDISAHAAKCVREFLTSSDTPLKTKLKLEQSTKIVEEAFSKFTENELALSFNGGKDCLVMLYILLAVAKKPLQTVYIRNSDTFAEVDEFVYDCEKKYNLDMEVSTQPMKKALESYLKDHTHVKAVFVGIRRADPWSEHLTHIQRTDHGWPDFIRIHPVIEWEYDDVWSFIKFLNIPYCSLYDQGYTSLGSTVSTIKNPSLKRDDGTYAPAYELKDHALERVGRNAQKSDS